MENKKPRSASVRHGAMKKQYRTSDIRYSTDLTITYEYRVSNITQIYLI